MAQPSGAPYAASKHALVALCEATQQDLRAIGSPVQMSVYVPGTVRSGIASSERHRQVEFGAPSPSPEAVAALEAHLEAHGLDGVDAAADLLKGVEDRRFYIFARNLDPSIAVERSDAILSGDLPRN